jgi:hypothetical protein
VRCAWWFIAKCCDNLLLETDCWPWWNICSCVCENERDDCAQMDISFCAPPTRLFIYGWLWELACDECGCAQKVHRWEKLRWQSWLYGLNFNPNKAIRMCLMYNWRLLHALYFIVDCIGFLKILVLLNCTCLKPFLWIELRHVYFFWEKFSALKILV